MQIEKIPKGGKTELEVKYSGQTMSFHSEVLSVFNNSVLISPVTVKDQTIGFSENCILNFIIKIDKKVYIWEDIKAKLVKYEGGIYHKVDLEGEGKIYNRRDSYRIYIGEDMPVYISSTKGSLSMSVLVKDLSETGVAFITKEEIDLNRTIRLKVKDFNTIISMSGLVVRKEYLDNLKSYVYGCKFSEKNMQLGKFLAKKQSSQIRQKVSSPSKFNSLSY